jgi:hypothetical protein
LRSQVGADLGRGERIEDAENARPEIRAALDGRSFSPPDPAQLLQIILDHRKRHFDYYDGND